MIRAARRLLPLRENAWSNTAARRVHAGFPHRELLVLRLAVAFSTRAFRGPSSPIPLAGPRPVAGPL
jgi:hypothetical protein